MKFLPESTYLLIHNMRVFITHNILMLMMLLLGNTQDYDVNGSEKTISEFDFSVFTQTIPGSDENIDFIPIQGGTFEMGPFESGETHQVEVESFWIGKTEITWNQYDPFVRESISDLNTENLSITIAESGKADALSIPTPPYVDMSFGMGKDGYPAISMTHYAAVMYTKWLYAKTGVFYRLPTEAEWEYACKQNHKTGINGTLENGELNQYAWFRENSERKYQQVGTKKPGETGIYDMLGNVSEWTLDQFHQDYVENLSKEPTVNPFFRPDKLYPRAVRGGSWMDNTGHLACTSRKGSMERWQQRDPQLPKSLWWLTDAPFVGFRIVRPKTPPSAEEMQQYWIEAMEAY